jgi:hypothetical protein
MSLLGCSALRDSPKPAAVLTLTATVSARFESTDAASGASVVKEYTESSFSRVWDRAATSTGYEIAEEVPAVDEFRLVNDCCCWTCQWTTMIRSAVGTRQTGKIEGDLTFLAPYTLTEIAFSGDDPTVTNDTSVLTAAILFDFPPDPGEARTFCHATTETDGETARVPFTARFLLSGITGISNSSEDAMGWDYTDGNGGSDSGGPVSALTLPTSGSLVHSPIDSCADLPSGWVQIDFSGDTSAGGVTDTTTASLRLEFAFS